jgi:pumilio family protein 6
MEALLQPLTAPYPSRDTSPLDAGVDPRPHPIDLPHTSRVYKTLLQGGHFSHATKTVARAPSWSPATFAAAFMRVGGRQGVLAMARGEGGFVVAELCERVREEGGEEERRMLKEWFVDGDVGVMEDLESGAWTGRGGPLLLEKVRALS